MKLLSVIKKVSQSSFIISHHRRHLDSCALHYLVSKEDTEERPVIKLKKKDIFYLQ